MSQETVAAQDMLTRFAEWQGRERPNRWQPTRPTGTVSSCNGSPIGASLPTHPDPRQHPPKEESILRPRAFHLRSGTQSLYLCPAGQSLNYGGRVYRNRAFNYIGTRKKCGPCSLRPQCTSAAFFRGLIIHQNELPPDNGRRGVGQHARVHQSTAAKKEGGGLVRGTQNQDRIAALAFAGDSGPCASSSSLAAVAQNLKRLVRFLRSARHCTGSAGHHLVEPKQENRRRHAPT